MENQTFVEGNGIMAQINRDYPINVDTITTTVNLADIERVLQELWDEYPSMRVLQPYPFIPFKHINNKKMEVSELMIGDHVLFHPRPVTILQIKPSADIELVVLSGDIEYDCYLNDIEPLFLSEDILNNNFSSTPEWWFVGSTDIYLRIYREDKEDCYFINIRYKGTYIRKKIKYVHELQHCLKLCNYNKNIIV